jgi:peptidoglycan hydrolase-like amidase
MKNILKKYIKYSPIALVVLLASCDLAILQDPKAFTIDKAQDASGAYQSATGAIKNVFDGHQKMAWAAGFVGNEEIQSVTDNAISQIGLRLERENTLAKDNPFNRSIVSVTYQGLALAVNARQAIAKNTFSDKGKALLLANVALAEGIAYGDMAKFYAGIIEYGTGNSLDPAAAKTKAITALTEAITQFKAADFITTAATGV